MFSHHVLVSSGVGQSSYWVVQPNNHHKGAVALDFETPSLIFEQKCGQEPSEGQKAQSEAALRVYSLLLAAHQGLSPTAPLMASRSP